MNRPFPAQSLPLGRLQFAALLVGVIAIVACAVGIVLDAQQFYRSYLFAYVYWWTVSMGCLGMLLLYQMTGGGWGSAARPFLDSGVRTLPVAALCFTPVAIGMTQLYDWTRSDFLAAIPHSDSQQWYLQPGFFVARTIVGFVICIVLGWIVTIRHVRPGEAMPDRLLPTVGGLGSVLAANVLTLEAVDWTMTLQPQFFSTIYGAVFIGSAMLCGTCVAAAGVPLTMLATGCCDERATEAMHDIGKLLLAMLMVWAYLSFSQFLITYSGNLPHAAEWYVQRLQGGWEWLGGALIVLHFCLPFLLLLSRRLKRNPLALASVAIGLAAVHVLDVFWTITPYFHRETLRLHWLDVVVFAAIGGIWLSEFFRQLKQRLGFVGKAPSL